ncbi:MAG TPA: YkgJ family cysteine cluster protein [Armatimonadota bacterium]|nr:YkgJ family cysteine cluster protein [Armatimonadota bacterium]
MSKKTFSLSTPPAFQCYSCQGCGDCCRGRFAIIISAADRERLEQQQWSAEELQLNGQPLFTPQNGGFQLAHRADGACVFLDDQGRCRIHARYGESEKPLPCRLYPFRFVPLGNQVRVDVRFDCPSTAGNFGHPIPSYRSSLLSLMPQVVPEYAATLSAPPFYGNVRSTWAQLCRITETFERLLLNDSLDITRRVLGCVNFAAALRSPRIVSLEGRKLSEFLETVLTKVIETAEKDTLRRVPPPGIVQSMFRHLLSIYARMDRVGEKTSTIQRLKHSLRMSSGRGQVPPIRQGFPSVAFTDIDRMSVTPQHGAAAMIERYLHLRLSSMSFFGRTFYDRSYLDGMNSLLLTYPLVCWIARAYAVEQGLQAPDAGCMEQALQIVDHQHGMNPLLNIAIEHVRTNFLTERSHLRSLVIWYGS